MEINNSDNLLQKYNKGICTIEEKAIVESWFLNQKEDTAPSKQVIEQTHKEIWNSLPKKENGVKKIILYPGLTTVAALLVFTMGIWLYFRNYNPVVKLPVTYANDINPGGYRAILTLADGKRINLSDAKNGALTNQGGIEIVKKADGQLIYKVTDPGLKSGNSELNTISTPKGGQYQIILPDGTKVWLNAASTLRFAQTFIGLAYRTVELNGEAYFEVSKDKKHPFIVKSKTQEVKVLGTHFNISTYEDEADVKTTLLEGAVRIVRLSPSTNKSIQTDVVLKPGEQSVNSKAGGIKINRVDTDNAVAWKNGEFMFRNEPLESVMRKIARWYDVEIVYTDKQVGGELFGGIISRSGKVSDILTVLEQTGDVNFKIEGRRIIVMK